MQLREATLRSLSSGIDYEKETVMEEVKLNNNELSEVAGGEESEQNGDRCPNCGSTNTTMDLALLMHFCMDCGYRWD